MLWNGSEEVCDVQSQCEEVKALTVTMETEALTGKSRQNLTCVVY